jgi:hypothetical protein
MVEVRGEKYGKGSPLHAGEYTPEFFFLPGCV